MKNIVFFRLVILLVIPIFVLNSCGPFKYKKVDARNIPTKGTDRVRKNIEEGRGFTLQGALKGRGGTFDFASSNELWRASLDTIDFMPLVNANYSGGIIITDWYSEQNSSEFIKISIRFLTNEIRAGALDIKVFRKVCPTINQCRTTETGDELIKELTKNILRKAAVYEKENQLKRGKKFTKGSQSDTFAKDEDKENKK